MPPDGYLEGVRALCDKHGILLIADEVMSGFGRTGEWFAVDHWKRRARHPDDGQGADQRLRASSARSACAGAIADHFTDRVFSGGLTYNSHPLACAAALATIAVYEDDRLIERARTMGALMADLLADLAARHPSVGAVRSIGLFGIVELVRNRTTREPMAPFNGSVARDGGARQVLPPGRPLHVRPLEHVLHQPAAVRSPRRELREGFAIIDRGLVACDAAVVG